MFDDTHTLDAELLTEDDSIKPMASEAFHGIAGEFVKLTLPQTEADRVGLLGNFLIASSVLFGKHAVCIADGRGHAPLDFCIFVGKTGQGRKGTASVHALAVMKAIDPDFEKLHVLRGLSTGEGLVKGMQDRCQKMIVEDRRFLCFLPEFGGLLEVMTRQGNTMSSCLRQAWDGDPLHVMTRKDALEIDDFSLGIIGHVTPDELLHGLSQVDRVNGFANRFLFFSVHRSKYLPEGGEPVDYSDIISQLRGSINIAKPSVLRRTPAAKELWAEHYERLSTPPDNLRGALCSRAEAHCLRLSLLYALLDDADAIDVQHVRAALAVWAYSEASVSSIFGAHLGDIDAEKILRALIRGPLNISELHRVFGNNKPTDWLLAKLGSMVKKGLIVQIIKEGDRKSVPAWTLRMSK